MQNNQELFLKVKGIKKSFGSVEVLKGIDFEVKSGEVMALVGDNGAGKSTLMKTLAGSYSSDFGDFYINGEKVNIKNPNDATNIGIQIVYQDLALCENLDVVSNLFLGNEKTLGGLYKLLPKFIRPLDKFAMEKQAQKSIDKLGVKTLKSIHTKIEFLSGGQRQTIAIARAVGANCKIVLLDEPTAALGVIQTRQVLETVKKLRNEKHGVVYISHNLRDVFEISDRICVLWHGQNVATYETKKTNPDEIVKALTSGEANFKN